MEEERGWVCYFLSLLLLAWPWSIEAVLLTLALAPIGSAIVLGFQFLWEW